MNERQYGIVVSFTLHALVLLLFFALSQQMKDPAVRTCFIQLVQTGDVGPQAPLESRAVKRHEAARPARPQHADREVRKDIHPAMTELPAKPRDVLTGVPEPSRYRLSGRPHEQTGPAVAVRSSLAPVSPSSPGVETEFGAKGAPAFLKMKRPVYPRLARRLGREGKVVLRLVIDERGTLTNIDVVEPAGYGFTEAAVEAVRGSTFSPAHEKGRSITSRARLTVRFVLKDI